ncbi:DUF1156 domain-containing protein [Blastococcus goldschmidtiae]|uniref:DUF1156 domain-containing protein n=1 Tax=Blastococcus goldschmidtiae TaxID=3075546 RepID=A0ABU2K8Y8_9ACTN|nr:DUF1156 domain-containing protein [Blastococcus sp. DSM 46792]MDT0276660.1 DUF1156 domain-containing protein [Blastococcus sp. DSM 46792]
MTQRRKLIEVALPLEAINRESAREKSVRHGHPATMHLWWSRKPLATARAVIFAQLVDDPGTTAEARAIVDEGERTRWVNAERARLFRLIERLVTWENSNNQQVLDEARREIARSTTGQPPTIFDPFAGGGAIPLEAQRLGLRARAADLNPVAVLLNKALIEIPSRFPNKAPVFPGISDSKMGDWPGAAGLAEDVRLYAAWISTQVAKRVRELYPDIRLPDGSTARVIAWIWARTVTCPNPACNVTMPLTSKWWLGKKPGKEAYVVPVVDEKRIAYTIGTDPKHGPDKDSDGTMNRTGAVCVACKSVAPIEYIRAEGQSGRLGSDLIATVAEGPRRRIYLPPTEDQAQAARVDRPSTLPAGIIADNPRWFSTPAFGMKSFVDLFTNRQLVTLTTFASSIQDVRAKVLSDARAAGMTDGAGLEGGGSDAFAYADAIATFLAFAVSRLTSTNSSLSRWNPAPSKESVTDTFGRQALPMVWEYAEGNPWIAGPCNFEWSALWVSRSIDRLPTSPAGQAVQADAASTEIGGLISTDPPYYDNIGYSDLSDYFYVWLRTMLREIYPEMLSTLLVPKAEELVANPYRRGGKEAAKSFFESGFKEVFRRARLSASEEFPITVYYAFKQTESTENGEVSTGWETLLEGMLRSGWQITATWPMRSERTGRMTSVGANTLASSIVLALRPRPDHAPVIDRRGFTASLRNGLPERLRALQQGSIAPVDLPQAAIGPGMAVFSSYSKVVEAGGATMSIRSALQIINQVLGEVLSAQEGDFDSATRWCVKWFESYGFAPGPYGEAETLASAYNTSVAGLGRSGALSSRGGKVQLFDPAALGGGYDPRTDDHITLWEVIVHLAKALDEEGLDAAGLIMARAATRIDLDAAKELAYLMFSIAEKKRWSGVAQLFNLLAASWADVVDAARRTADDASEQLVLDAAY